MRLSFAAFALVAVVLLSAWIAGSGAADGLQSLLDTIGASR